MEEKRKNNRIVSRMPVLPSMPVKKRVAAYARVSLDIRYHKQFKKRSEGEVFSIDRCDGKE